MVAPDGTFTLAADCDAHAGQRAEELTDLGFVQGLYTPLLTIAAIEHHQTLGLQWLDLPLEATPPSPTTARGTLPDSMLLPHPEVNDRRTSLDATVRYSITEVPCPTGPQRCVQLNRQAHFDEEASLQWAQQADDGFAAFRTIILESMVLEIDTRRPHTYHRTTAASSRGEQAMRYQESRNVQFDYTEPL